MAANIPNRLAWWISALLHGGFAFALANVKPPVATEILPEYQPFDMEMLAPPAPQVAPPPEPVVEPPPPEPEPEPEPEEEPEPEPEPNPEPVVMKKPEPPKPKPEKPKEKPKPKKEKPKEPPKPKPEKPKEAPREPVPQPVPQFAPPSRPIVAPITGVPSMGNAAASQQSSANVSKNTGQSASKSGESSIAAYYQSLGRAIYKNRPRNARQRGVVVVSFNITPSGEFVNIRLDKASGNPALDEAALSAVTRTARFHPPPNGQTLNIRQPIKFD